jgi:hypothetical protein
MKTVMGATDFMAAGAFTYNNNHGDVGMKLFSIQRDQGPNGLTTFIRRALCGRFALQIPMAYPPGCMLYGVKTNQDVDSRYFDALASYCHAHDSERRGALLDLVSLFNEAAIHSKVSPEKIQDPRTRSTTWLPGRA